jgi:hypothetical protein
MLYILNTLYADNPWFANIKLKEQPRWLCGADHIGNKEHSSLVLTLEDQESLKELIEHNHIQLGTPYAHQRISRHETEQTMPQMLESHT